MLQTIIRPDHYAALRDPAIADAVTAALASYMCPDGCPPHTPDCDCDAVWRLREAAISALVSIVMRGKIGHPEGNPAVYAYSLIDAVRDAITYSRVSEMAAL